MSVRVELTLSLVSTSSLTILDKVEYPSTGQTLYGTSSSVSKETSVLVAQIASMSVDTRSKTGAATEDAEEEEPLRAARSIIWYA